MTSFWTDKKVLVTGGNGFLGHHVVDALKKANLISNGTKYVKVFASGEIKRAVTLKGIRVTKGARIAIEAAGGKID